MARYVFLSLPADGHVNVTLGVVEELVARGETVVYYLPERYRAAVEALGAEVRTYETTVTSNEALPCPFSVFEESQLVLPQVLDRIEAEAADAVVYGSMCWWARVVVERLGLPAVRCSPSYVMTDAHASMFASPGRFAWPGWREKVETAARDLERLSAEYGVGRMRPEEIFTHTEPVNVVFMPRAFQPDGETFDERYAFVGASVAPARRAAEPALPGLDGRRVLYLSLGTKFNTQPEFFRLCAEALGGWAGWQVVLACGQVAPEALGPIPENFVVAPFLPQLRALEAASVFVTHGGINSVMEAVYFGVPMLVLPQMYEQAMTGNRVEDLRLGLMRPHTDLTPETLRETIEHLAGDAEIRDGVRELQRLTREAGGHVAAADAVMARASAPGPAGRPGPAAPS